MLGACHSVVVNGEIVSCCKRVRLHLQSAANKLLLGIPSMDALALHSTSHVQLRLYVIGYLLCSRRLVRSNMFEGVLDETGAPALGWELDSSCWETTSRQAT